MLNNFLLQGAAGLLGGLFGNRQSYDPMQQFQMGIAKDMRRFGQSAPMSDPGEQAALANSEAMLGEQLNNQRQNIYSQMPANVTTSPSDMTQSIAANEMSQRMAMQAQMMMDSMNQRRQALMNAAGIAQGVGPRQQQGGIGQMLGGLAQQYGAYQTQRQGQQNWQDMLAQINQARMGPVQGATQGVGAHPMIGGGLSRPGGTQAPMMGGGPMGMGGNNLAQIRGVQGNQPLSPQGGDLFNPAFGMPRSQQGNNFPMAPPPGAGYGNPTPNNNLMLKTPDLFSQLKGSGVR